MTLDDLVVIGKLGNSNKAPEGFLRFKPNWNFRIFFLDIKDIFLVFPDHRVRYVTIEEIRQNGFFWIRIKEKDVVDEITAFRSVEYRIPKSLSNEARYKNEDDFLIGMKVLADNVYIGNITDTFNNGAHNTLVVRKENNSELLIPVVNQYIELIDKKNHSVTVKNIEGLLNL